MELRILFKTVQNSSSSHKFDARPLSYGRCDLAEFEVTDFMVPSLTKQKDTVNEHQQPQANISKALAERRRKKTAPGRFGHVRTKMLLASIFGVALVVFLFRDGERVLQAARCDSTHSLPEVSIPQIAIRSTQSTKFSL